MARGRCAGCGFEDASCKAVKNHIRNCNDYIELYRTDKSKALEPEEEYLRHRTWKESEEAEEKKLQRDADRASEFRSNAERIHARQRARWSSKPVPLRTEERPKI